MIKSLIEPVAILSISESGYIQCQERNLLAGNWRQVSQSYCSGARDPTASLSSKGVYLTRDQVLLIRDLAFQERQTCQA